MKKKQVNLKHYLAPQCAIIQLKGEISLLTASEIKPTPGSGTPPIQVGDNEEEEEELEFD